MKTMLTKVAAIAALALGTTGCAGFLNSLVPNVYLVDRHTIVEADAAGEWPELEQRLRADVKQGPQAFAGVDEQLSEQPAFRVLNGEFVEGEPSASESNGEPSVSQP